MVDYPIPLKDFEIKNDNKGNILLMLRNVIMGHDPVVYFVISDENNMGEEHDCWLGGNYIKSIVVNNGTIIKIHREIVRFLSIGTTLKIKSIWMDNKGNNPTVYLFMEKKRWVL